MSHEIEIKIPDIGGAVGVDVIEILVKPEDIIAVDTPLITLESDKASMEIPSPRAGKVKQLALKLGDKVQEGDVILTLVSDSSEKEETQETHEAVVEPLVSSSTEPMLDNKPAPSIEIPLLQEPVPDNRLLQKVPEDSSTDSTKEFSSAVEFPKKSNVLL